MSAVRFDPPRVHSELPAGPGLAVFDGELGGDSIGGTFTQAGVAGTFWLRRAGAPAQAEGTTAAADRAPYREEEISFTNGDVRLVGTLTLPPATGPFPAVVLISGSGPQDRDETLAGFRPFKLIADYLGRHGIAVLRYDDRGVGGSSGSVFQATARDFAADVASAVRLLRSRPEIDPNAIGLIGHSEGGIVAPLAAAESDDVQFIVLLAGTAVRGDSLLFAQGALIARAMGASASDLAAQRQLQQRMLGAVRTDRGWDELEQEVRDRIRAGVERMPPDQRAAITDVDAFIESQARQQFLSLRTPWFRFFIDHDPALTLQRVDVPVLALFGERDLQVPPSVNRPPMARALRAGGNPDYTIEEIPGANHLFQAATTGTPAEYVTLEKTFVPDLLQRITHWIRERTGSGPSARTPS